MMTKEWSTKIFNLMTPGVGGSCAGALSYSENAIFLLLFLSTLEHGSEKLSIKQNDQGRVYQIVNFMTPEAGVL